jgi:hypothetical protein
MNRRGFLGALLAGAVLDPERALWKPGKLISIPALRVRTDCVTVFDWHERYSVVERWWKEGGGVYRQVRDQAPQLTPFTEVPFVKIPPFELPLRLFRTAD